MKRVRTAQVQRLCSVLAFASAAAALLHPFRVQAGVRRTSLNRASSSRGHNVQRFLRIKVKMSLQIFMYRLVIDSHVTLQSFCPADVSFSLAVGQDRHLAGYGDFTGSPELRPQGTWYGATSSTFLCERLDMSCMSLILTCLCEGPRQYLASISGWCAHDAHIMAHTSRVHWRSRLVTSTASLIWPLGVF